MNAQPPTQPEPNDNPPVPTPEPTKKKSNLKLVLIVVGAVFLACVAGIAAFAGGGEDKGKPVGNPTKPAAVASVPQPATSTTTEAPAPEFTAKQKDFKVSLKILDKECFGSAGCLIGYRVELGYTGPTIPDEQSYEISFRITGAEDEILGTLTTHGTKYDIPDNEHLSTKSTSYNLKVSIVGIERVA